LKEDGKAGGSSEVPIETGSELKFSAFVIATVTIEWESVIQTQRTYGQIQSNSNADVVIPESAVAFNRRAGVVLEFVA
jgi:hypothetical protein